MATLDNSIKPVEDFILSGLAERFYKVFGTPLLFYNGPDVKAVASKWLKQRTLAEYPYAVAKTNSLEITEQTFRSRPLLRTGIKSRASNDNVLAYQLGLAPVTTTYEITFYVQGGPDMLRLAKQWVMCNVRGSLKFSITYGVVDIDIDVKLDNSISIPQREGGVTEVKEYVMTAQMKVMGYLSDQLKTVQAVTDLEIEITVLEELGLKGGKVDILHNEWPTCSSCTEVPAVPTTGSGTDDKTFVYTQTSPSSIWPVSHNMGKHPSVTVVDDSDNVIEAKVYYASLNTVIVSFDVATIGKAYLN